MKGYRYLFIAILGIVVETNKATAQNISDTCYIGNYHFNGNPADISGNGYDGVLFGPVLTSDKNGNSNSAYLFDGIDDYIELNNNIPIINTDVFTISCWARMDTTGGGVFQKNALFDQRDEANPGASIITVMAQNSSDQIAFAVKGSTGTISTIYYPSPNFGEWHHYACVLEETDSMRLFLDGIEVEVGFYDGTGNFITGIDDVNIGRQRYGGQLTAFFNGAIDEFKIFDCALSASEISSIFSQQSVILRPNACTGKDAYFKDSTPDMNQGAHHDFSSIAWTNGGNAAVGRSTLQFDLAGIPSDAIVESAYLSLYNNPNSSNSNGEHSSLSGSNESVIQRITTAWNENTVTWNNQPATSLINGVGLSQSTSIHQDYLNINVSDLVQDMIDNPDSSYGIMIKLVTESYFRSLLFSSSDHPDSTKHPKLEVNFTSNTVYSGAGNIFNYYDTTLVTINQGDSVLIDNTYQLSAGYYPTTYQSVDDCDSIVTTKLEVISNPSGFSKFSNPAFNLNPNPNNGIFNLVCDEMVFGELLIYNAIGKLIKTTNLNGNGAEINLSGESKGIYFVQVRTDKKNYTSKFIIK